jgi:hypothetical protein
MPIYLIDKIKAKNAGNFPMVDDIDLFGGWRVVADTTARDAIPTEKRAEGMRVKVLSEDKTYELKGGITNSDWEEAGGGVPSEGVVLSTIEDLTYPIDCNDVNAVDAPLGTIFATQAEIDDYLTSQSATNFKHIYSALRTLPQSVEHEVDLNLAAGVQYADPIVSDFYSLPIEGFEVAVGGIVRINGRPLSEWTQIVAPQTVTSFQEASNDPWVQVSGTPFASLDLRGRMAVLSNGAYGIINSHDDNTLHLMKAVLPNPTVSVDTVFVGRPNTSYRNALAATPTTRKDFYVVGLKAKGAVWGSDIEVNSLQLEGVGSYTYVTAGVTNVRFNARSVIIDHEYERVQFGSTVRGRSFQSGTDCIYSLFDVGIYASPTNKCGSRALYSTSSGSQLYAYSSFICNHTAGILAHQDGGLLFRNLILDTVGSSSEPSVLLEQRGWFQNYYAMGGAIDTIRNAPSVGIDMYDNSYLGRAEAQLWYFENCGGPCVRVRTQSRLVTVGNGFRDGGGNSDVGIEIVGPYALVQLDSNTDVTGTNGDVKMADGGFLTYSDIETNGPYSDSSYNWVEKTP